MDKLKILDPKNIKVDQRSLTDLINFIGNISKELNYFDEKNNISGTFYEMFSGDESFLISEISSFDTNKFFDKKNLLIKRFDESVSDSEKLKISLEFLKLTHSFFAIINEWFERAFRKDVKLNNTSLQTELESVIKNQASVIFQQFKTILKIYQGEGLDSVNDENQHHFKSNIWHIKKLSEFIPENSEIFNNEILFKKLVLINNSVFKIIRSLVFRSRKKLSNIVNRSDHNPHIGLLFSFLTLFKNLQTDINKISKKHLDFYYNEILSLKLKKAKPNFAYAVINIDDNVKNVNIGESETIFAGQYDDGTEVRYRLKNSISLNNAKISYLMSIFVSKNEIFEYNSRYRIISSIFSKTIAKSPAEVDIFNENNDVFNALGIDQNLHSEDDPKMDNANVGFIIGAPCLSLGKSNRVISIKFKFDSRSITHLTDLLIDFSNNNQINEDETFSRIFSNSFKLFYTSKETWEEINDFEIISPDDWSDKTITFLIRINKSMPAFSNFDYESHNENLNITSPAIKFLVKQDSFYNSFGFLNKMKLDNVNIKTEASKLGDFKIFVDGDEIPASNEFELFGPNPNQKSSFYIGCEELFNKKITDLKLKWKYSNIDKIENDFEDYYKSYKVNINNKSFVLGFSFLSDFNYVQIKDYNTFQMFDEADGKILENKEFNISNIINSKITPKYSLQNSHIDEFSNEYETGMIKVSLLQPNVGFGSKLFNKLNSQILLNNSDQKNGNEDIPSQINEPFSPKINDLYIDYKAESTLYFDESMRLSNDFDEDNSFFHLSPFGVNRTFSKSNIENSLFHDFKNEGELVLGFESESRIKNLDLLFEILKNENDNYQFSRDVDFYYSTKNGWKEIPKQNILSDETSGLLNSGIISLIMPDDFSADNYILGNDNYHLKLVSKNKADQFGLVKSVYTNSAKLIEVIPDDEKLRLKKLSKGSLVSFENNIEGVSSIHQPLDSPTISLFESQLSYYHRVSQILKHKNRPVTNSDYESFIIQNFDFLSYVRIISNDKNKISILCLKKINNIQNIDEIKLSVSEKNKIKSYLKKYAPGHISFEILNPTFEDVWIKCSVLFKDIYVGRGLEKLNYDLLNYICPWRSSENILNITDTINNIDLLNFIKSLDYISYVSGFSVIHFSRDIKNKIRIYDSASEKNYLDFFKTGSKQSIFVPRNNHKIEILTDAEYVKPTPISFEDFEIDESFIIGEKNFNKENDQKNNNKTELNNLQFIIK